MERRNFLTAAGAAGLALASGAAASRAAAGATGGKQLLELRLYHFKTPAKQKAFDDFLKQAAVPALNRAAIKPVGVFKLLKDDNPKLNLKQDSTDLYILLPHNSFESFLTMIDRLAADWEFTDAAMPMFETPKSDPPYERFESSLMLAFDGCPKVEVPTQAESRLFQLRVYESHNDERALMKIAMFNEGGEIAIFRKVGMNPVFFGQTLVGSRLPNLTYMLGFANEAAMTKAWGAFRNDPGWKALSSDPTYRDTVSNITNLILRPAASSQI
jgi:hypothetical protein